MDCIFCKIAQGSIPAKIIYQDDHVLAFDDLHPQAPQHKLIIPRRHISTMNDIEPKDAELLGKILLAAKSLAKELNIDEEGYRLVFNCNAGAGQAVFHIHCHLLGGRAMHWPPG